MFRLLSKVFADTTMLYMPISKAAPKIESCLDCANHDSYSTDDPTSNQTNHSRSALGISPTRNVYMLPSEQEVQFLFNAYFTGIGTPFPYINDADVSTEYRKARAQNPPKFRAVFLALVNIIWAHACASVGKTQREIFYNRSVALLDLRTLERPGYELGKFTFVLPSEILCVCLSL